MSEVIQFRSGFRGQTKASAPTEETCCFLGCEQEATVHVEYLNMDGQNSTVVKHFCVEHAPLQMAAMAPVELSAVALGFEDMEAAVNMRNWLELTLAGAGAQITGGGYGFGQADLDIELEGCHYNVAIRPIMR